MKTYSVSQVAEMLETNPETVRRWVRDKKIIAIQPQARKDGIIITEDSLSKFVDQTPKFLPKYKASKVMAVSTVAGIAGGMIGGIVAGALLNYFSTKKEPDYLVSSDDFKAFLKKRVEDLKTKNEKGREVIRKTELEISQNSLKIEQYQYLLNNEGLLEQELEKNNKH